MAASDGSTISIVSKARTTPTKMACIDQPEECHTLRMLANQPLRIWSNNWAGVAPIPPLAEKAFEKYVGTAKTRFSTH